MGNYQRCQCGKLYKPYNHYQRSQCDIDPFICPSCNAKLDNEYKKQQEADQEEFKRSLEHWQIDADN